MTCNLTKESVYPGHEVVQSHIDAIVLSISTTDSPAHYTNQNMFVDPCVLHGNRSSRISFACISIATTPCKQCIKYQNTVYIINFQGARTIPTRRCFEVMFLLTPFNYFIFILNYFPTVSPSAKKTAFHWAVLKIEEKLSFKTPILIKVTHK